MIKKKNNYNFFFSACERFIIRDITLRNTVGGIGKQGVALLFVSEHSVFYRCSFEGYQDTLCAHAGKQFFKECDMYKIYLFPTVRNDYVRFRASLFI